MGYALRPGLHFCTVDDQAIFLDLIADRYFCLADRAAQAFDNLVKRNGADLAQEDHALLVDSGLVVWREASIAVVCPVVPIPTLSALDLPTPCTVRQRLVALFRLIQARRDLQYLGLDEAISKLERQKACVTPRCDRTTLLSEAHAFSFTARLMRSHDQCLPRSLAVTTRLAALDIAVDLVIGVRLRPFAAHSWAQTDALLLNDRFDTVRSYQPILVV